MRILILKKAAREVCHLWTKQAGDSVEVVDSICGLQLSATEETLIVSEPVFFNNLKDSLDKIRQQCILMVPPPRSARGVS